ncbi:prepilin peptidase [Microbacterium sp. YY-01]|uniref:prepilin peptidase n=1 Tax=Microbacterium sp. YY-01 TaxID=3421634 RepID=UPI003D17EE04
MSTLSLVITSAIYTAALTLVYVALVAVGLLLIWIDIHEHRLPNRIVIPATMSLLVLIGLDAVVTGQQSSAYRGLIGLLALGGFYYFLRMLSRGGIGGGDVKLAAGIGLMLAWHGWLPLLVGAAAAFVVGAAFALFLMMRHRADKNTMIAFGPWMIMGAAIGIAAA